MEYLVSAAYFLYHTVNKVENTKAVPSVTGCRPAIVPTVEDLLKHSLTGLRSLIRLVPPHPDKFL